MSCNFGINSAFAVGPTKTTDDLDRVDRSPTTFQMPTASSLVLNVLTVRRRVHVSSNYIHAIEITVA